MKTFLTQYLCLSHKTKVEEKRKTDIKTFAPLKIATQDAVALLTHLSRGREAAGARAQFVHQLIGHGTQVNLSIH